MFIWSFTGWWYSPSWWYSGHDCGSSSSVCVDGWFILGAMITLMHHRCAAPPSQSPISLTQARWGCKPAINNTHSTHTLHNVLQVCWGVKNPWFTGGAEKESSSFLQHVRHWGEATSGRGPMHSIWSGLLCAGQQQKSQRKHDNMLLAWLVNWYWRYTIYCISYNGYFISTMICGHFVVLVCRTTKCW